MVSQVEVKRKSNVTLSTMVKHIQDPNFSLTTPHQLFLLHMLFHVL